MSFTLSIIIRFITLLSKFALLLLLARCLPINEIGLYGIITTSIIIALQIIGVDFYAFNTRELLKPNTLNQAVLIRDQWIVHAASYLIFLPIFLFLFISHVMPWQSISWFYILLLLEHNAQEVDRLLITLSQSVTANIVVFFRSGAWVLALFFYKFFLLHTIQLITVWQFWIIGDVIALCIAYAHLRDLQDLHWKLAFSTKINFEWIKKGLKISSIFLFGTLTYQLLFYINRYIIQFMLGLHAVGIYIFFGSLLGSILTFAQVGIFNFRMPTAIKNAHIDPKTLLLELYKMYALITIYLFISSIIAILVIHEILRWTAHPDYQTQLPLFYWLLAGTCIVVFSQVPHNALYICYQEKKILKISTIVLTISVLLNIILIQHNGLIGAAQANLISMLFLLGYKHTVFMRGLHENCYRA